MFPALPIFQSYVPSPIEWHGACYLPDRHSVSIFWLENKRILGFQTAPQVCGEHKVAATLEYYLGACAALGWRGHCGHHL